MLSIFKANAIFDSNLFLSIVIWLAMVACAIQYEIKHLVDFIKQMV